MTDKSVDAFRTISEVAEDLDLPQHVLRFWETRFGQIRPMKRGGGRRYYRPDDVELLKGIRFLLYVKGYTIKGVQRILRENGNRFVMAIGAGDTTGLDTINLSRSSSEADEVEDVVAVEPDLDDDPLPAYPPSPPGAIIDDADLIAPPPVAADRGRGFPRFLMRGDRSEERAPATGRGGDGAGLPRQSREVLQQVIVDLLECKRLLDQVR
ncbi:MerR family transcriptional regulator [Antarcticirhabdus aurantiaca]|uniref:MerR family transcriptional regulator n=1 Tax=Antarcticirhabdus aurantiaca TaxID=2606717 RepID=A0ACD4NHZ4_9HYPH|nr:MerR family transcriptional regulator [Antarcticirhabdus aurantiaca]WAJ26440.1 MerR family transcriptional regulator [Jeongeuplla avenae]